jgi:regulatory protein
MSLERSGEWLAPVTPLHRGSVESVDDSEDVGFDSDDSNDVDVQTIAVRALARKGMSVREMEKLLRERDANPDDIAVEVARLESVGLLNDDDLATDLAERLQRRKGMGANAIKTELVKRLIRPSAIEQAIETLPGEQEDLCMEQARQRLERLRGLDREVQYRRLQSYLARRGFRGSDITAALREVLGNSRGGSAPTADNVITVAFRDAD